MTEMSPQPPVRLVRWRALLRCQEQPKLRSGMYEVGPPAKGERSAGKRASHSAYWLRAPLRRPERILYATVTKRNNRVRRGSGFRTVRRHQNGRILLCGNTPADVQDKNERR